MSNTDKSIRLNAPTDPILPGLNRRQSLGKLPLLRRPVTLYDPHSNRFQVIAANDNGALLAGPPLPHAGGDMGHVGKLRLGRRVADEDHFFLVEVLETETVVAEGQEPWTRFRVRWCAFAGSNSADTANFAAHNMNINLDARRVRVTRRMAVASKAVVDADLAAEVTEQPNAGRVDEAPKVEEPAKPEKATATSSAKAKPADGLGNGMPATVTAPVVVVGRRGQTGPRLSPTPTTPTGQQASHRGPPRHASRRADGPRARRNTVPPVNKPKTTPSPAPAMGPVTEDLLLQGRRPIPLGTE